MLHSDWFAVADIYQKGIETNLATFQPNCPSYEDWDAAHTKECRLVIEEDGNIIGWAVLSPVSKRRVYAGVAEVSVYIAPDAQGKGVGTRLLGALCDMAEEHGYWTLQSSIMPENQASIRLHQKCGFRLLGYRERIGRDREGNWRDNVLMEKRSTRDDLDIR